jgi:segregation and condensation protein B
MNDQQLKNILEGALLAAGRALTVDDLLGVFEEHERPEKAQVRAALEALEEDYRSRGAELKQVASGFRLQVRAELAPWISRLWVERPSRYSRALLETLALVAYRQPITRGEIEDIRGVGVSSSIMKTMQERDWIKVVGHRDVPGKPALYGTTRTFLDYFNLKGLDDLPSLAELRDIDTINAELDLGVPGTTEESPNDADGPAPVAASDDPVAPDVGLDEAAGEGSEAAAVTDQADEESDRLPENG